MAPPPLPHTHWYTSSAGLAAETSACDQSSLEQHVSTCLLRHGTLGGLGNGVRVMQGLVATRFVTAGLFAGLVAAGLLWL